MEWTIRSVTENVRTAKDLLASLNRLYEAKEAEAWISSMKPFASIVMDVEGDYEGIRIQWSDANRWYSIDTADWRVDVGIDDDDFDSHIPVSSAPMMMADDIGFIWHRSIIEGCARGDGE